MESPKLMDAMHKNDKGDEQDRCQLGHVSQQAVRYHPRHGRKGERHGVFDGKDRRSSYAGKPPRNRFI